MSRAEIFVVVTGYVCVFFVCRIAWMQDRSPKMSTDEFMATWIAGAILCWGAQWLLAKLILEHPSPNVFVWSIGTGLLISIFNFVIPAQKEPSEVQPSNESSSAEIRTDRTPIESYSGPIGG